MRPRLQIVAEAENRAPKDAGLGPASVARISALSVSAPVDRAAVGGPAIEPAAVQPRQNGQRQVMLLHCGTRCFENAEARQHAAWAPENGLCAQAKSRLPQKADAVAAGAAGGQ